MYIKNPGLLRNPDFFQVFEGAGVCYKALILSRYIIFRVERHCFRSQ